jgi:RsiW-degrading membrane proteinase PrsW (M82 family)
VFEPWRRRLQTLAGTEDLKGFSLREMFSQVFQRRTDEELDDYFIVGTYRTTPPIEEIEIGWPKPWFFGRVLLFVGAIYLAFSFATTTFGNVNLIPGLIMMGSIAVPLATVFLFFELNLPRNVSLPRVLTLFCAGGITSVIISLIGYNISTFGWLGDMQAGIIEEVGKVLAVALLVRGVRYKYTLNGMLFGAAVGAGFAAFESGGYAFRALLASLSVNDMTSLIRLRAVQISVGVVGWYVVFGLVQEGLREVKADQLRALQRLDHTSMQATHINA